MEEHKPPSNSWRRIHCKQAPFLQYPCRYLAWRSIEHHQIPGGAHTSILKSRGVQPKEENKLLWGAHATSKSQETTTKPLKVIKQTLSVALNTTKLLEMEEPQPNIWKFTSFNQPSKSSDPTMKTLEVNNLHPIHKRCTILCMVWYDLSGVPAYGHETLQALKLQCKAVSCSTWSKHRSQTNPLNFVFLSYLGDRQVQKTNHPLSCLIFLLCKWMAFKMTPTHLSLQTDPSETGRTPCAAPCPLLCQPAARCNSGEIMNACPAVPSI